MHEKKLQQELERQKEEDEQKKKTRKTKQVAAKDEPPLKKSQPSRQVAALSCPFPLEKAVGSTIVAGPSVQHVSPPEN